jgi:hypothetical protein
LKWGKEKIKTYQSNNHKNRKRVENSASLSSQMLFKISKMFMGKKNKKQNVHRKFLT